MDNLFYKKIEVAFTDARLGVFRADGCDNETAMTRYLFNIEICKSLYSSLHILEVVLRNSIDKSFIEFARNENWFETMSFTAATKQKIHDVKQKLAQNGKEIAHDRIISELTLGFWTTFISAKYGKSGFQPFLIKKCFANCPKYERNVKNLQKKFERIRLLRNRVSHYERIIHWKDLAEQHTMLLQCIQWLSPESYEVAVKIDAFNDIYSAGLKPIKTIVTSSWNNGGTL